MMPNAAHDSSSNPESAFREKEESFRLLIEHSKDGITLTDMNGITVYASPAARRILGYDETEISGTSGREFVHPVDLDRIKDIFRDFLPGKSVDYEMRVRHKNGKYRWIEVTTTNLVHVKGIASIVSNFRDVTERKEMEQAAQQRERELRNLANAMPQLAWIADPDGTVVYYSERIAEYGGAVRAGQVWVWGPLVHDDDIDKTERAWAQSVANKTVYDVEHRIRMKDGSYRFHLSRAYPQRNDQGEVIKWFGTATDIDEQKQAQQLLEQYADELSKEVAEQTNQYRKQKEFAEVILDSSIDVIAVYDHEARLVTANKKFYDKLNLKKEETTGKKFLDIFPEGSEEMTRLQKALNGEAMYSPAFKSAYSGAYFESHIIPLRDIHEKVYAVLVMAHDVTKSMEATEMLKQSADQLRSVNDSLIKQNEELEQFAYVASHDLQEPLRKITTFAKMLERALESQPEDALKFIQKIIQSSNRMSELIRDVLKLSQLNKADSFQKVDLNEILNIICTDLELLIEQKKATIQRDRLPVIEAVPQQMTQLFYNLISNSLKFSNPDQGVVIRVSSQKVTSTGLDNGSTFFKISFSDNGIGFNQAYADKIFMMFQRLNTREHYSGSGIGLAMVKKIVSNHRGHVVAEGEEGVGASFHVTLPEMQTNHES